MRHRLLVVMPAYNSEQTIGKAIESILGQSYENLQINIVDDSSTDHTLKIAKRYARKDKRIKVYSNKENRGAYYSRNLGIYVSRNDKWDFFTTHDADDVSFEHRYSTLLKYLNKEVVGVGDTFTRVRLADNKEITDITTMAHAVFKRSVFDAIGYFEEVRFGGDWEYWARLREYNNLHGLTTRNCNVPLGISYIHDNNLTVQIPERSAARARYIKTTRKKLASFSDKKDYYQDFIPNNVDAKPVKI